LRKLDEFSREPVLQKVFSSPKGLGCEQMIVRSMLAFGIA
jgi:hypothetical protein